MRVAEGEKYEKNAIGYEKVVRRESMEEGARSF
jgi:hypothetical protein